MCQSRMMASGWRAALRWSSASAPPVNAVTSKPASSRLSARVDRNRGSSSTTTMRRRSTGSVSRSLALGNIADPVQTLLTIGLPAGQRRAAGAGHRRAQGGEFVAADIEIEEHVDRAVRPLIVPDLGGRPVPLGARRAEQAHGLLLG